jgi:hypothetical protein
MDCLRSPSTRLALQALADELDLGTGCPRGACTADRGQVLVIREPAAESWGVDRLRIEDTDGIRIVLVEVPVGLPLRRDPRSASPPRCDRYAAIEDIPSALPY